MIGCLFSIICSWTLYGVCILSGDYVDFFEWLLIFVIFVIGSFSLVSKFFIDGMYVLVFGHATKTMSGATIHPLDVMLLMSG